jgi:hypothetical protein
MLPPALRTRLQVTQQCRPEDIDAVRQRYAAHDIPAELGTYFEDMAERLADAHLFIGRSGASTIAELTAVGRPAILVPLPIATDDHQAANAREMVASGGARSIRQEKFTAVELAKQIQALAQRPETLANAAHCAWNCGHPNAAADLADLVEGFGGAPLMDVIRVGARLSRRCQGAGGMKGVGTDIGTIHFVGIGGIGMSGIAEVMANLGYTVQGSDIAEGYVVEGLRSRGIKVMIGHAAENLGDAAVVVTSTAVKRDNPEVVQALENRVPVVRRAEMLAELMRLKSTVAIAGTHGKTTTTSMVAALLDAGGVDPTVINGGIINSYGSNARLGASDWMVVEADESDGSFLRLDGTIAVVTNIDPEHLDHYGSFERVKQCFVEFIENVPFTARRCCASTTPKCRRSSPRCATAGSSPMASALRPMCAARRSPLSRRQPLHRRPAPA